jgi:hypothetical protein
MGKKEKMVSTFRAETEMDGFKYINEIKRLAILSYVAHILQHVSASC